MTDGDDPTGEAAVARLRDLGTAWWVAAVVFFGVGDAATTAFGVHAGRAAEASPVVAWLLADYGPAVMVPMKAVTFAVFWAGWRLTPPPYRIGYPVGLTVVGTVATGWNVAVLALA